MNIYLNGTPLPWQDDVKHLGNTLETNNSFSKDCDLKRGKFIGKVHSLFQELHFASPEFVMKMYEIYCSSFYGSNLWKLSGSSCERIYTAWNTACRILFEIPRTSHRYLIEPISKSTHPKVFLSSRFVKYHMTLINSNKSAIRCLANLVKNDLRTVYGGQNLYEISVECKSNINDLSPAMVKNNMNYFPIPEKEEWRLQVLEELLNDSLELSGFDKNELKEFIDFICTT